MVVVPCPSFRLTSVAHAPSVSASAMIAPPCSTSGLVHNSLRTSNSAVTRSGDAPRNLTPSSSEKGSGLFWILVNSSIAWAPRLPSLTKVRHWRQPASYLGGNDLLYGSTALKRVPYWMIGRQRAEAVALD